MPRWSHSSMKCAPLRARLAEEHAVVGDDADRVAVEAREAGHEGVAVVGLELVELAAVDEARDDLAHVVGLRRSTRDDAVELVGRVDGRLDRARVSGPARSRARLGQGAPRCRARCERVLVVLGEVVGDARDFRVCTSPPPSSSAGHHLAGRRLHQRRAAEEDRALVAHDDGLVAHRGHVGAAGRARAHHHGDLRDAAWPTAGPGCRRCGRSGRGRETPRPAGAGTRRRSRRGRCRAVGSRSRSPGRAGAS